MTFGRSMKIDSIADLQDLETALRMAIRVSEEMIADKEGFDTVERATIQTQKDRWSKLLSRVQEYGK